MLYLRCTKYKVDKTSIKTKFELKCKVFEFIREIELFEGIEIQNEPDSFKRSQGKANSPDTFRWPCSGFLARLQVFCHFKPIVLIKPRMPSLLAGDE